MKSQRLEGPGFTIELEERPGYLRALVSGKEDSVSISTAYWALLGAECRHRGVHALLVVEDLPAWPNVGPDVFEAVTDAMVASGFLEIRCAFVDMREEVEANEYGMIVGAEKGLTSLIFSNESYAERWLRYGPSSHSASRSGA